MASIAETMLNSALKGLDFSKLLNAPQVQEAMTLLREVAADFKTIKNNQGEILKRLDEIEAKIQFCNVDEIERGSELSRTPFNPNHGA